MRVTAGAHSVRQYHPVQPGVDDAVTGTQRHTAAGLHEIRQLVLQRDIHWLRIGGRMTEALHHEVGGKTQTGKFLELVARHGPGSILRTHCCHLRFTIGARPYAVHTAGPADHLLRQGVALAGVLDLDRPQEHV